MGSMRPRIRTLLLVAIAALFTFSVAAGIGFVYAAAPSCTTLSAINVTATSVTLRGSVNPNGKSTGAQFFSDIWLPGVGMSPPQDIGSGVVAIAVSYTATGLTPSTSYYYWVGAANSDGSCHGATLHFTTLPAVVLTDWAVASVGIQPPSPLPGDPVTLQASVIVLSTSGGYPQNFVAQCALDGNSCGSGTITYPGPTGVPFTVTSGSKWTATAGSHTLSWKVGTTNDPNPGNNFGSYTFSIAAPTPFDFDIASSPNSLTLQPEQTQSVTVTVSLKSGTTQPVSLTVSGQPSGVTASLNPTSGTPTFSSTLTIAVSSTVVPGTYTLTIEGSGGGQSHLASLLLTISQAPDFRIDLSPASQSATQGQLTSYSINVVGSNGFSSQVSLTVSGLPAGVNGVFSTNSGTPTFSSTLTVTLPAGTPPGTYTLVIHGTGGGLDRSANAVLIVTAQTQSTSQATTTGASAAADLLETIQRNSLLIIAALVVLAVVLAAVAMRSRTRPTSSVPRVPSQIYCGKCGAGNPAENEFCSSCGSRLKAA
jgi:VCBS repeat-containing protein